MRVAVFGASARPGLAQVRQLVAAGHEVRAVSRSLTAADPGVELVDADLDDPASLVAACQGVDAVFYTSPTFAGRASAVERSARLGAAAREAGVARVVYNTTTWHPDAVIGVPTMDHALGKTEALRDSGAPLTVIRPSLFMDNLLTAWVKPELLHRGVLAYPHREDLRVSWISLDDVARAMISTLSAPLSQAVGAVVDVGGPEALTPPEVAVRLARVLGRSVAYERVTEREFGRRLASIFGTTMGMPPEQLVDDLEAHYVFKNAANPFEVAEVHPLVQGLRPEPMSDWLARQDWSPDGGAAPGSLSG